MDYNFNGGGHGGPDLLGGPDGHGGPDEHDTEWIIGIIENFTDKLFQKIQHAGLLVNIKAFLNISLFRIQPPGGYKNTKK